MYPASCVLLWTGKTVITSTALNLKGGVFGCGCFCAPGRKILSGVFSWLCWTNSSVMQQVSLALLTRVSVPWTRQCPLLLLLVARLCWLINLYWQREPAENDGPCDLHSSFPEALHAKVILVCVWVTGCILRD